MENSSGYKNKSASAAKETKASKLPKPIDEETDEGAIADEEDEVSDVDDQTEALLKGFESDGDEAEDDKTGGRKDGEAVPKLSKETKAAMKKLRAEQAEESDKPGVVYVGRIPHGFYENEMREYFKQFGTILKLRMSRNPKTGASRHFAFIQFESAGVADIVARTMDNYLLFQHILKVKLVPDEQVHDELFKGANKRFKKIPWNKMKGRELSLGATEATWEKRIEKEKKRRQGRAEKAKEIGYEFKAPSIKSAKNVAKKPAEPLALEQAEDTEVKAIEAAPAVTKGKKAVTVEAPVEEVEAAVESTPAAATAKPTKEKKSKKVTEVETPVVAEATKPKAKKEKKAKDVEVIEAPSMSAPVVAEKKLKKKKSKTALA